MKKVMVFGVFDGIHDGHRALFGQAKKLGDHLIVVVAQDKTVEELKGHGPRIGVAGRCDLLGAEREINQIIIGDAELGTWDVIKTHRPQIIALGYDQQALAKDIASRMHTFDVQPEIVVLRPHRPDELHNSLLQK